MPPLLDAPRIRRLPPGTWPDHLAGLLTSAVERHLAAAGRCSVMLTGGRSAALLYSAWPRHLGFTQMHGVDYYFGDERCVPPDDGESNYGLAMRTLFADGLPAGCLVHRMEGERRDIETAADDYAARLPPQIDVLLLSVGDDGHIASLFPYSSALWEGRKRVVSTIGPKPPNARLTITPRVVQEAKEIFILSFGDAKRKVLSELARRPDDCAAIPARLAMRGEWITEDLEEQ